jgi:hypothetical protein
MKLYGVVIMDIVDSRKIVERHQFQQRFNLIISRISKKHADILAAPIAITLGDEWQVVTRRPSECYNFVHEFQQILWNDGINLYAGIGLGTLTTPEDPDIRKMDGPCFHFAREAVNIAKGKIKGRNKFIYSKKNRVFLEASDIKFLTVNWQEVAATSNTTITQRCSTTETVTVPHLINIIIENNEILKAKLTPKQKRVYLDYLEHGSYRNIISTKDDGSIGAISQKLNNAEFFTIQRNHEMVKLLLDYYTMLERVK